MATNSTAPSTPKKTPTPAEKAVQDLRLRKKQSKGKAPTCGWPTEEEVIKQAQASAQTK